MDLDGASIDHYHAAPIPSKHVVNIHGSSPLHTCEVSDEPVVLLIANLLACFNTCTNSANPPSPPPTTTTLGRLAYYPQIATSAPRSGKQEVPAFPQCLWFPGCYSNRKRRVLWTTSGPSFHYAASSLETGGEGDRSERARGGPPSKWIPMSCPGGCALVKVRVKVGGYVTVEKEWLQGRLANRGCRLVRFFTFDKCTRPGADITSQYCEFTSLRR